MKNSGSHVGKSEGAFGPATLKRDRNLFVIPRMSSGSLPQGGGFRCCCADPRPMRRNGDSVVY